MGLACIALVAGVFLGVTDLSGTVVDAAGQPVPGARVFVEAGLAAPLQEATAGADGGFHFEELGIGDTGVFAYAPGHAFGGTHLDIAVEETLAPMTIRLGEADAVDVRVVGGKDTAIQGAHVTRVGLLGADKVGIPLSKLKEFGIEVPISGADGRVSIPNLPRGGNVALKITHPQFAVEGVPSVAVGEQNVKVQLYVGVLLEGDVVARGDGAPIANVPVIIRNAQPPHDTTLTNSDARGKFSVRLKPGVYLYQSAAAQLVSSGWTKLVLEGENPMARARVAVGGIGTIRGEVRDAKTSQPIPGARISLTTNGNRAAVERTGPTGVFLFSAGVGENVVRLEVAQGYLPPTGGSSVKLSVKEGETTELPGMWLAPLPRYKLQVVDDAMAGVPGALVHLLQPEQFGIKTSAADGWLDLNIGSLPEGGAIIGVVESPDGARGALFRLEEKDAGGAKVQLFPLASVSGTITNTRGKPLAGVVVGGAFPGAEKDAEPVLLWKTISGPDGAFRWPGVMAGVPQIVVARLGSGKVAQSAPFNLAPEENKTLGALEVEGSSREESLLGKTVTLSDLDHTCGPAMTPGTRTVVLYTTADAVAMSTEGLAEMLRVAGREGVRGCVVSATRPACSNPSVPILMGKTDSAARTLVLDASGVVTLETFGLPPLFALR